MDTLTRQQRSKLMSRVRSKNTGPEMKVRRLVFSMGFRYRLHVAKLPGKPDLVFRRKAKVIFVHGCFWHGHDCGRCRIPKTRTEYWMAKIKSNVERDARTQFALREAGWSVLILWECMIKDEDALRAKLENFLQ
ncbi:very short patch repair endonuclease [uncultured Aquitalea sp.]|uniref:very short patch repair endonuclease n=1 Tax=uncultured Aquitalea sp. TaxID=540272 RepID=UPI0025ED31F2|nr:very short patch repair endonuclease [uncultured Aquitalea sp.]